MNRIEREKLVVRQMIAIYCHRHHAHNDNILCDDCLDLLNYAHRRLDYCPKGNGKSSCRKCEIHCYSTANREKIRAVMKYVGPRMIFIHPWSAIATSILSWRKWRRTISLHGKKEAQQLPRIVRCYVATATASKAQGSRITLNLIRHAFSLLDPLRSDYMRGELYFSLSQ